MVQWTFLLLCKRKRNLGMKEMKTLLDSDIDCLNKTEVFLEPETPGWNMSGGENGGI